MTIVAIILLAAGVLAAYLARPKRPWPRGEHPKFFRQP